MRQAQSTRVMNAIVKSILILNLAVTLTVVHAADVRVGVAASDITPPLGIPMAGYYHARGADGVLDPLLSKAMVIEADGVRGAFVALDLISVTREKPSCRTVMFDATTASPKRPNFF